uniref:Protein kinase domain-containing protein n=1 Tax=viral metagenome TaxID=1070528 RepID=A0A6C0AMI4_9ZZZZ
MFNSNEIGLDWKGSLETLSTIPRSKSSILDETGSLKDSSGKERCKMILEETVADNTLGKLVWVKRFIRDSSVDLLVKKPVSQKHAKQEAVIQWLVNKSLSENGLGEHCPKVIDIFSFSGSTWFSMEPIYSAPLLDTYLRSLPTWSKKSKENGHVLINIIAQIALSCIVLERTIGFNHRDLKPDNILVKLDSFKARNLKWRGEYDIHIAPSHTAILVDYGFSCLGPGKIPWIQSGDGILPPFDACPKVGRDIFMILVFLLWQKSVRDSLIDEHLDFLKMSLRLTTDRLAQMMNMNKNPSDWIYILITERGFQCPALDPLVWLKSCATTFPEIVIFR